MEHKNANFPDIPMEDAMKIANSDAAKALFAQLQAKNGPLMQQAMAQAASGDMESIKQTVSQLLNDPKTMQMLQKLKE